MFEILNGENAKKLMENDVNIFDVRDKTSFNEKHIENARFLSADNFIELCESSNKTIPTLVYCYKGFRSQTLAKLLAEQGFEKVFSLEGGFNAWSS